jgi:hypothetical protein
LIQHLEGKRSITDLKRTFTLLDGKVAYINNSKDPDYKQAEVGTLS